MNCSHSLRCTLFRQCDFFHSLFSFFFPNFAQNIILSLASGNAIQRKCALQWRPCHISVECVLFTLPIALFMCTCVRVCVFRFNSIDGRGQLNSAGHNERTGKHRKFREIKTIIYFVGNTEQKNKKRRMMKMKRITHNK